jgi:hypothetical protein
MPSKSKKHRRKRGGGKSSKTKPSAKKGSQVKPVEKTIDIE